MSKPSQNKNVSIPDHLLKELLTSSEIRMLKNRWQIVQCLKAGLSIRSIAKKIMVGTDTVVRVARMSEGKGVRGFLDKNSNDKKSKTQIPWVFGKNQ